MTRLKTFSPIKLWLGQIFSYDDETRMYGRKTRAPLQDRKSNIHKSCSLGVLWCTHGLSSLTPRTQTHKTHTQTHDNYAKLWDNVALPSNTRKDTDNRDLLGARSVWSKQGRTDSFQITLLSWLASSEVSADNQDNRPVKVTTWPTIYCFFLFSVYNFCTSPLRDEGWE